MVRPAWPKDSPDNLSTTSASASAKVLVTRTPFPAASPSVLTTHGAGRLRRKAMAGATSVKVPNRAVGIPASSSSSFMKAFEPSSCAPSAPGPTTSRPMARSRSASPSTRGASGPTTTRSQVMSSGISAVQVNPSAAMPGFPGATVTATPERRSARAIACSRPPDPTTRTWLTTGGRPRTAHGPVRRRPSESARRSGAPRTPRSPSPVAAFGRAR